uniref:Peroxisome proliferator-activated receptor gamma coactivator-related protein 1 n=2 Tax=Zeugodacus cucurbitae TaxID=28588 RepID=A0A0A1WVZ4_ZEUCU
MDSRLLNVFHDDPFDGSYAQLNTDFWSSENDTMGQLTETLNGILPIAADDEHDADMYNNAMLATEDNFRIANKRDVSTNFQNKELLFYDDFAQHQLPADGGIEIITVDPNSLDSDSEDSTTDDNDMSSAEDKNIVMKYADFDDNQSQYSDATFRTRTDSSSIGDYESHTSDYDDSTDDEEIAGDVLNNQLVGINQDKKPDALLLGIDEIPDLTAGLLAADGIDLDAGFQLPLEDIAAGNKNRTMSTNTIGSDVDVNNFDLAEFITNDDLTLTVPKVNSQINHNIIATNKAVATKRLAIPVKSNIDSDSDAESDVIVDIETVDADMDKSLWKMATGSAVATADNAINDVVYEDNVKKDPSWSPKPTKKQDNIPKETKVRPTTTITVPSHTTTPTTNNAPNTRNFTIVPNKRQCDILKGKSGAIKNKSTTKQSVGKSAAKKGSETTAGNVSKAGSLTCRVGVGQGGKNLALLSQSYSANDTKPASNNKTTEVVEEKPKVIQPTVEEKQIAPKESEKVETMEQTKFAVKRKLNLEEYKRRRGDNNITGHTESAKAFTEPQVTSASVVQSVSVKHSKEVTTVVKTLRNQSNQKLPVDPITEAKNKVLRMQELKRAQQLKIIDSTISAKVPRVTKLPPLKDIVKDTYCSVKDQQNQTATGSKLHPDYEEVIIVSAGSNTDISIPPLNILPINTCERSLLKSSALLYNMPSGLSSSSSLIASIQDVVVQKVVGPEKSGMTNAVTTPVTEKTQKEAEQHGEDKVIMHLRKDRIRPRTVSMGIQTDPQPGFARLPKIPLKQRAERSYRKQSGKAVVDETDSDVSCDRTYNRQRNRSRSPINRSRGRSAESIASSTERNSNTRQSDMAGGYSSRSSRRHRSSISSSYSESGRMSRNTQRQPRTSYKKRTKKYARDSSASSSSSSDMSERSRNRSRSRSPYYRRSYSRSRSRSRSISRASSRFRKPGANKNFANNNVSQPAVEERRIVYVGRIEEETTKEMLRRKFLPYGTIKQISIHYKDTGMKYGFVTYERSQDAFTVIDGSARDPTINMYDISFGGRRAFCRSSYADLDNAGINTYHSIVFPKVEAPPKQEDSFEALLQKVKAKISANKSGTGVNAPKA